MTAGEIAALVGACFGGLSLLVVVAEKLWGGGNALAAKFHMLDKDTTAAIERVRIELNTKLDEYERVSTVGFEAVKANIHAMQIAVLEFRAKMAEELHLYIQKGDYNTGIGDVRRDMAAGFRQVDDRLGQLQDLIMYSKPDMPNGRPHG